MRSPTITTPPTDVVMCAAITLRFVRPFKYVSNQYFTRVEQAGYVIQYTLMICSNSGNVCGLDHSCLPNYRATLNTHYLSLETSNHVLVVILTKCSAFVATHAQVLRATEKKKHQTAMCEESHAARTTAPVYSVLAASLMQPCTSNAAIINTFSQQISGWMRECCRGENLFLD